MKYSNLIKDADKHSWWSEEAPACVQFIAHPLHCFVMQHKILHPKFLTTVILVFKERFFFERTIESEKYEVYKYIFKKMKKDKNFLNQLMKDTKRKKKIYSKTFSDFEKNKNKINNKQLCKSYTEFMNKYLDFLLYPVGMECVDIFTNYHLENMLKHELPKVSKKEFRDIIVTLTSPNRLSFMEEERIDFIQICLNNLKNIKDDNLTKELKKELENLSHKYFYVLNNYQHVRYLDANYFFKRSKEEIKKNKKELESEIKSLKNKIKILKQNKKKIYKKYKLSTDAKLHLKIVETIGEHIDWRKSNMLTVTYYFHVYCKEIAKRFNINIEELKDYTYDEIQNLLLKNKQPDQKLIKKRNKFSVYILESTNNTPKTTWFYGKQAKLIFEKTSHKLSDNIKGQVANASAKKLSGKVQIILDVSKQKFKEGNILVTSMTRPEFVPLMRKAKAIITDEGGITCHAAVVSREMKKTCIIGTKFASKVLKDGDYVEIDTHDGTVKKVKNQKIKKDRKPKVKKMKKITKKTKQKFRPEDILWFKDVNKKDIPTVGGKGANLGEMYKHFPIPEGFCVTVNSYKRFMDETSIGAHIHGLLDKVDVEKTEKLDKTAENIRKLILKQKFPLDLKKEIIVNYKKLKNKKVAVRSSATAEDLPTASFAGQQDTYLNINSEKDLIKSVQKCWASLFTARAIYYREKNNFKHRDVLICVVIQEMVDAKYAGVMFTVDPVNKKHILIEVVEGLGEALVSGQVTPNTYFMNKRSHKLETENKHFDFNIKTLEKISKIGEKVEDHYKKPQDIEFCIDKKGKLLIVQSRPITTL